MNGANGQRFGARAARGILVAMDPRRFAPATDRNREAILHVLERVVPQGARVLEIASGSGQHAAFLASRLPITSIQPTDADPSARESIDAWKAEGGDATSKMLSAASFDVTKKPWPAFEADVVLCINMIHIAPWEACEALFEGAGRLLRAGGILYLYGPYRRGGAHTAPSNEAFDESLRSRDARWGVRDLEAVVTLARSNGFGEPDVVPMPANNFSVVFRRT